MFLPLQGIIEEILYTKQIRNMLLLYRLDIEKAEYE